MEPLRGLLAWIELHPIASTALAIGSLLGSIVLTAVVVRLPPDFFVGKTSPPWFRGQHPLVRVVLSSGHEVIAARGHPFYRLGMDPVPAEQLAAGDALETAFRYPEGYVPPDLAGAAASAPIRVVRVEPAGEGEVMTGTVRDTHALFVTAGILCGE